MIPEIRNICIPGRNDGRRPGKKALFFLSHLDIEKNLFIII